MSPLDRRSQSEDLAASRSAGPLVPPARVERALRVRVTAVEDRTMAVVTGEIDSDCAPALQEALEEALRSCPQGALELDMSRVGFCDCVGLNVLLRIRLLAEQSGATVTLCAASAAVRRLIDLTDTRALFLPVDSADMAESWP